MSKFVGQWKTTKPEGKCSWKACTAASSPHSGMVWGSQYGQKQVKCRCQAPNLLVTTRKLEGLNLFVFQPRPAGHPCGLATSAIGGPRKFLLESLEKSLASIIGWTKRTARRHVAWAFPFNVPLLGPAVREKLECLYINGSQSRIRRFYTWNLYIMFQPPKVFELFQTSFSTIVWNNSLSFIFLKVVWSYWFFFEQMPSNIQDLVK